MSTAEFRGFFGLALGLQLLSGCGSSSAPSTAAAGGTAGAAPANIGGAAAGGSAGARASGDMGGVPSSSGSPSIGGASAGGASSSGASSTSFGGSDSASGGRSASGGASAGSAATGAGGGAAGAGGGGSSSTPFTCTLLFGVSPTGQWFDSGFLQLVDGSRWESIWIAHHYTSFWADPNDSGWAQALDPYPGPSHACARNSTAPDRIVFVAVDWTYTTAAQWEADLNEIVANLQNKYPSVRRVELMTLTRAPGNVVCAAGGSSNETIIPAWTDVAIAATAAKYPGLVVQAPKFEVPHCADFMQGGLAPQYTDAGAQDVAQVFGAYYAAHP